MPVNEDSDEEKKLEGKVREDRDSFGSPTCLATSLGEEEAQKAGIGSLPQTKVNYSNLNNISSRTNDLRPVPEAKQINDSYKIRMQMASLDGGGSSAVAFEAKMIEGDL